MPASTPPAAASTPDVFLNLNVRGLAHSATVAINARCDELLAEGRQVFKLGLGQSPFPVPESVVAALRDAAHQKAYLPVQGLPELRSAVAAYHRRAQGVEADAADVLIGPGSKELMFLLQLVFYGDLIIPAPSWVSYAPQARIIGRRVRFISTRAEDDWRLTPAALDALCAEDPGRPRLLILNYPNNPTGGTYRAAELQALAEVAARYRVLTLSDEIYGELEHRGEHESIARYYPRGTIISSGLSKWCGAGGWRLGTFLFPKDLRWVLDAMAAVASETFTSTSAPIQYAAVRAFRGGADLESYLSDSRRVLRALGGWSASTLSAAGLDCVRPQGGFYLFPDFSALGRGLSTRGVESSAALCEKLMDDTGVAILPGSDFGRDAQELTARLAYVNFDGEAALRAAAERGPQELDEGFLRDYCGPTVAAIEAMAQWSRSMQ